MEMAIAGGIFGIWAVLVALLGAFLAVPLAIIWEQDAWLFEDIPWWLMIVLVPLWLVVVIWQGFWGAILHAD